MFRFDVIPLTPRRDFDSNDFASNHVALGIDGSDFCTSGQSHKSLGKDEKHTIAQCYGLFDAKSTN
jgi:hypothetical protein